MAVGRARSSMRSAMLARARREALPVIRADDQAPDAGFHRQLGVGARREQRSQMGSRLDPLADDDCLLQDRQERLVDLAQRHVLEALDLLVPADALLLDGMEAQVNIS